MNSEPPQNETPNQKELRLNWELSNCERSLLKDPENPDLLFQKGFIYNQLGRYEDAIKFLELSIQKEPTVKKYQQLGLAYCEIGNFDKSISAYNKALKIEPKNPETHNFKGFANYMAGNLNAAMNEYKKALSYDAEYNDAILNLGVVLDDIGYHEEAIQCYERLISLNPRDCCAHLNKGMSLLNYGKYDKAINEFEKSIQIRNDDSCSHFNKGCAHYYNKEFTEALNEFDIALSLDENYAEVYFYKGLIYEKQEDNEKALCQYNKAIAFGYTDYHVYQNRGEIFKTKQMYPEAIEDYQHAASLSSSQTLYLNLGECYYFNKEYERAINYLTKISSTHTKLSLRRDVIIADSLFCLEKYHESALRYKNVLDGITQIKSKNKKTKNSELTNLQKHSKEMFEKALDNITDPKEYLYWNSNVEIIFPLREIKKAIRKNNPSMVDEMVSFDETGVIELNKKVQNYITRVIRKGIFLARLRAKIENHRTITLTSSDIIDAAKRTKK